MNFQLTADQADLRDATRKLCEGRIPIQRVRSLEGVGFDAGVWGELADAGVFSLPELGFGSAGAALVFEELGRGLVPGPLVWTYLGASLGVEGVVGGVERDDSPLLVEHVASLDALLVLSDRGVWRVDPVALEARSLPPLDPLTPVFSPEAALPAGEQIAGPDAAARLRRQGAVLTGALLAGIAGALTDLAVSFAKERQQFGRPIGSFQSIKHLLADMLVRAEVARMAVYAAAVHLDDPSLGDVDRAVAAAKLTAGHAAVTNGTTCVQVHGGMGYTWEVDAHLYLKRAWVLDTAFGSSDAHADAVAARLR